MIIENRFWNIIVIYYTGIGSRQTPFDICNKMSLLAIELEKLEYTLRSGGANGADQAFENHIHNKRIYLPCEHYNKDIHKLASNIAEANHPAWNKCSTMAKLLHTRNVFQVLGDDLKTPSKFVVCWTKDGKDSGGTGTAIRIAHKNNISVFNYFYGDITKNVLEYNLW